jgi:ABC-2 type transport system permease protein
MSPSSLQNSSVLFKKSLFRLLLGVQIKSFFNSRNSRSGAQFFIFLVFSGLVILSIYFGTSALLTKLDSLNHSQRYSTVLSLATRWIPVGDLIKERLFSMVVLAVFFMLVFSQVISSISHLYLSRDTELLMASPRSAKRVFESRFISSAISASWMSLLFFLPVLLAYTHNYGLHFLELAPFFLALIPFLVVPATLGTLFSVLISRYFPLHQSKKIFQFASVLFMTLVLVLIRMLQPERLFSIRDFTEIEKFISNLQVPFFQYIPSTWLAEISQALMTRSPAETLMPAIYLFTTALVLLGLTLRLGRRHFFATWCRSRELRSVEVVHSSRSRVFSGFRFLPSAIRAIYVKDSLLFARNSELWSQIFLIFAMVGLYLYNIHLLHLDKISMFSNALSRFVSFLNTAFVGFITVSISMRFLFPSISLEGPGLWILKSSPFPIQRLIWFKFLYYFPGILVVGNLMTVLANWILKVGPELYVVNGINISCLAFTNAMLAISFGAIYPMYKAENINRIFMSFGGVFYMMAALFFMFVFLGSQVYPGYLYYKLVLKSQAISSWQVFGAGFSLSLGILALLGANIWPYRLAKRALGSLEQG